VKRLDQIILIASTVLASWLGMQALHELGHVFGAWITGGEVKRVVLNPLLILLGVILVGEQFLAYRLSYHRR